MNRRTVFTIVVAVLIFFVFFNPFRSGRDRNKVPLPYADRTIVEELAGYIEDHPYTPERLLVKAFDAHDIVFLGEYNHVKQQVDVVRNALAPLYEAGVRNVGVEFALYEDQESIDRALTADSFDRTEIERVLFNRMVIWGYQEYVDLFREAWEINRSLDADEEPLRIVGLNVEQNWQHIESEKDIRNPETVARVFEDGIPDAYMARVIVDEFVSRGEQALIYTSVQHAFTDLQIQQYTERAQEMGLQETRRVGNIISDRIGRRAATILFHSPWPDDRAQTLVTFPVDGVLDHLIKKLAEDERPTRVGFFTQRTPFGELRAEHNDYADGHEDLTLEQVCDGYILTGPIAEYEMVTAIPDFITPQNLDEAVERFPGANIEEAVTAQQLNEYIAGIPASKKQLLERF